MKTRNHGLRRFLGFSLALGLVLGVAAGAWATGTSYVLPDGQGSWALPKGVHVGRAPSAAIEVEIRGIGTFLVDPSEVKALRPDVFRPGHLSVFDAVAHLVGQGTIQATYRLDLSMNTHVIESLNGRVGWWYDAHYPGGKFERTTVRMDHYPVKGGMKILLYLEQPDRLAAIYTSFQEEVARLAANQGRVVIPEVTIRGPRGSLTFRDLPVTPHDVRSDVFRPGVVTALDVLLSLGELGNLSGLRLTWRTRVGETEPVENYYVDLIAGTDFSAEAVSPCAFVYDVGAEILTEFKPPHGHTAAQIHLSFDLHVLASPEHVKWAWVCP
ncbi:MAG: hypothetical protein ABID40_03440 [Candidatus Bipolaricaulota bacterium]